MASTPLTESDINALVDSLWRSDSKGVQPRVFALLDGARNRKILPLLNKCESENQCLYSGGISYALRRAAPHIVQLDRTSQFTYNLLQESWGNSWGIFAITPPSEPLSKVRNNCRRIAKVESPSGKPLVFRYYDPRVLREFIPTCDAPALQQIFGPVTTYAMEAEDSGALIKYTFSPQDRQLKKDLNLVKDPC